MKQLTLKTVAKKKNRAFTLMEMLVVIFIIAVLIMLFVPNLAAHKKNASVTGEEAVARTVVQQKEIYLMENPSIDSSTFDIDDLPKTYATSSQKQTYKSYLEHHDGNEPD
jgi:competence protein ComGC